MKRQINSPLASKINWTATIQMLIVSLVAMGIIPEDKSQFFLEAAIIATSLGILIFRTFFTNNVVTDSEETDDNVR